jgi:hypothetical protein
MATKKFFCPPTPATGAGTFSDDLVGLQLVQGGGLTQGNFEFITATNEKENRNFLTGVFSDPINLETLGLDNVAQSKVIAEKNFKVYPNFDLTQITNFTQYGSMVKRMSTSVEKIINYFPAAIESTFLGSDFTTGATADNIIYNEDFDETSFDLNVAKIRNPFDIDFTVNATRNLELREIQVSVYRNFTTQFINYSLYVNGFGYDVKRIVPTISLTNGTLKIYVSGNPFNNQPFTYDDLVIRPNDVVVNKVFNENLDDVERFLLNRNINPIYTSVFQVPKESEDGTYYITTETLTWPLFVNWNLDIASTSFTTYLTNLNDISESFDSYRTNLVSRFLTTGAFKDFDTPGQKVEKVLQLYGRSFDETNKFIIALGFMNSVNYNTGNDIPSALLKNLAQTLGWRTNISPISETEFLDSVFGSKNTDKSMFPGVADQPTPDALNYQYYKNIILNAAFLFKSKGTRKSIENLLRLVGAPESIVEFNEHVYVADRKINMKQFETQFVNISGGTYERQLPILDPTNVFTIAGVPYTGFTTTTIIQSANLTRDEYPVDDYGYPSAPTENENYFFQSGSGWFEQTPAHRALPQVSLSSTVFTGTNPNFQTYLVPYTYGQDYMNRFRNFPFMDLGFKLSYTVDNNKSWSDTEVGFRINQDAGYNASYYAEEEKFVLNAKNVDLFLAPSQGILYDIWFMSRKYNFPIPVEGLNYIPPTNCQPEPSPMMKLSPTVFSASFPNVPYPYPGGVDWTIISPQPQNKTFFEFAQTIVQNTINVRNRQFAKGYPTLGSIFWRYLESQRLAGVDNDNFNYRTMIEYVNGLGDYWIRLVEQMVPATTIWNGGAKYENMTLHRQKFVYRRQPDCQIIPIPCKPCEGVSNLYTVDCPAQSVECSVYPWENNPLVQNFPAVLSQTLSTYLTANGYTLGDCDLNTLNTQWFVDMRIDDIVVVSIPFFNGVGYSNPVLSSPTPSQWLTALTSGMTQLETFGYEYYFTNNDTVVLFNSICSTSETGVNFKINVGINFNIACS